MGARNLILLSRSGAVTEASQALVRQLNDQGVRTSCPQCDVTSLEALKKAFDECSDWPPVRGCIQGTMVLKVSATVLPFQPLRCEILLTQRHFRTRYSRPSLLSSGQRQFGQKSTVQRISMLFYHLVWTSSYVCHLYPVLLETFLRPIMLPVIRFKMLSRVSEER